MPSNPSQQSFVKQLLQILKLSNAWNVFTLGVVAIINVFIVSGMGKVAGSFYLALVDEDSTMFWNAIRNSMFWYTATALSSAIEDWISEILVISWRASLTSVVHEAYFQEGQLYKICVSEGTQKNLDNPDQRISEEIKNFCIQLSILSSKTVTAPIMVAYYTYLVYQFVGFWGCFLIYIFFLCGAFFGQKLVSPLAKLIMNQEKLEGEFRYSHVRVRNSAETISLYKSENTEKKELNSDLQKLLNNQKQLATGHLWLGIFTKMFDYSGSLVNFLVLAAPVFSGTFSSSSDKGAVAQKISNASFAILQLIYSFTILIDSSKTFSNLMGHTTRLAEFFESLGLIPLKKTNSSPKFVPSLKKWLDALKKALNHFLQSRFDTGFLGSFFPWSTSPPFISEATAPLLSSKISKEEPNLDEASMVCRILQSPKRVKVKNSFLEYSIHGPPPPELEPTLKALFSLEKMEKVLIVPTFQCASVDICSVESPRESHSAGPSQVKETDVEIGQDLGQNLTKVEDIFTEMDLLLNRFLWWGQGICSLLHKFGFWANLIDPSTGFPLSNDGIPNNETSTVRYNEVYAAKILLGYETKSMGPCSAVLHPEFGERSYPCSLLTNAPISLLQEAVGRVSEEIDPISSPFDSGNDLLRVENVTFGFPTSVGKKNHILGSNAMVECLNFGLKKGESLLICGKSGVGKTSLLRCIFGLWPPISGNIALHSRNVPEGYLFLPQKPILTRGSLASQILYPKTVPQDLTDSCVEKFKIALEIVALTHLLDRVNGDWTVKAFQTTFNWDLELSPGEQQRLSLSRVFYYKPPLVVLDEATSAIGSDLEDVVYRKLNELNIAVISVSHSEALKVHHNSILLLQGNGEWELL